MATQTTNKNIDERLESAAAWHARLSGDDVQEQDWLDFTAWLEANDLNREAYNQVEDTVDFVSNEKDELLSLIDTQEMMDGAPIVSREATVSQTEKTSAVIDAKHRWLQPQRWIPAAAAAVLLFVTGNNFLQQSQPASVEYATAAGETRQLALADGSTVNMNVMTNLEVTMSDGLRQVRLSGGEAMFDVAKDADRPFVVLTEGQQIRVVGTKFNVKAYKQRLTVSVSEGIVDVSPKSSGQDQQPGTRLVKGKQLIRSVGASDVLVEDINVQSVGTWREGFVLYENRPLQEVVDDLNRYFSVPIELSANAQNTKFSGVLKTSDQDEILALLSETLPVSVDKMAEKIRIQLKQ